MKELEQRLYGLVPYNISDKQKGIQYGHAVQEINNDFIDNNITWSEDEIEAFNTWRLENKTFIILNGGTTNNKQDSKWYGSMNKSFDEAQSAGIRVIPFSEPDLGDQLSGFVFLVDERVFKKRPYPWEDPETTTVYPDFQDWLTKTIGFEKQAVDGLPIEGLYPGKYIEWLELIGGEKNLFLRNFLRNKRLA